MPITVEYVVMRRVIGEKFIPVNSFGSHAEASIVADAMNENPILKAEAKSDGLPQFVVWGRVQGPWMMPGDAEAYAEGLNLVIGRGAVLGEIHEDSWEEGKDDQHPGPE